MYFPLIAYEALMLEPTGTEKTLGKAADALFVLLERAETDPERLRTAPCATVVGRPGEVKAARTPVVRYNFR
jgi:glycine dehydrogenase subunit 2